MAIQAYKLEDNRECLIPDDVALKLRRFSGVPLEELSRKNPRLLIVPHCLGENGDRIGEGCLFSLKGQSLCVGNVVGFWGVEGVHVRVHSRFDTDERQYFFHYMLQRVSGVNVLNMNTLPDLEDVWDFLIYLFPIALKNALSQGVYRAYRVFNYDDDHLRGHVDVARFIRRDIPFAGHIAYSTRKHSSNSHVIQLVRHTVEFIRRQNPTLLSIDMDMRRAVEMIVQLTPDYEERCRSKVIAANLRPIQHPYYSSYTVLQKICLQILRHEKISFGEKDGSICGIVFDAAWLWEEYLAKVFAVNENGIVHPQNKKGKFPVCFVHPNELHHNGWPHYPDFYDKQRRFILDAKYKRLGGGIGNEDLCQLISYLHVLKYERGALIFPAEANAVRIDGDLKGWGGRIGRISLAVPLSSTIATFRDFAIGMNRNENNFLGLLDAVVWG